MATELQIIKTQDGVSRNFIFETGEIKNLSRPNSNMSVSLSLPTDDPTEDNSFNIDLGVERKISFQFKLYGETTDRAEGTYTSAVEDFGEIRDYLEDVICFPFGLAEYKLTWTDKFGSRILTCTFEDFTIDIDDGIYPTGNLTFKVKRTGA